jgi:thioredoxin reductase (NADPH)
VPRHRHRHRRALPLPRYEEFEGQGIHYAATSMEAKLCTGEEVIVVGGGNSAGQAAVFLSRTVQHVHILVRSKNLAATMSSYLIERIQSSPKITLHTHSEITVLDGERTLRQVTWVNRSSGVAECRPVRNVFVMIGAEPNTEWLDGCLQLCPKGFVATGKELQMTNFSSPYQTNRSGIYAVGDVRGGSVKRVAAGVGDGSVVVQDIHRFLSPDGL